MASTSQVGPACRKPNTLPPLFLQRQKEFSLRDLRRSEGSSQFRGMDVDAGLAELSYEARSNIIEVAGKEDRLHLSQALPSLRFKLQKLRQLDLSYRAIDGHLLLDLVNCTTCQAAHSRFPSSLDKLCDLNILKECASGLTTLDLTGASITPKGLQQLLALCPQLEYLSLEALCLTEEVFKLEEGLEQLRVLSLSGCAGLTDEKVVEALTAAAPNLQNLDISNSDISQEALLHLVLTVNSKLDTFSVADLGQRFGEEHLAVLRSRCPDLTKLDISSTLAAVNLRCVHFMSFLKLKVLMAHMTPPVVSLITAETLSDFEALPSLRELHIHRRMTSPEMERLPVAWNVAFAVLRTKCHLRLVDDADMMCGWAALENGRPYPKMQLTERTDYGGAEPL